MGAVRRGPGQVVEEEEEEGRGGGGGGGQEGRRGRGRQTPDLVLCTGGQCTWGRTSP